MKKTRRKKSIILRVLVLGVSVYMITTLIGLWNELGESRAQYGAYKDELKSKEQQVQELKTLLEDGSQAQIIEKAARERLGYVYSDEEIYVDISGN